MAVKNAFIALNTVMAANPIMLIIIAVTALVAAFIYLWNNCEGFRNFFVNAWETIKTTAINVWNAVVTFAQSAVAKLKATWQTIVAFFTSIWSGIKNVFSNAVNIGQQIVDDIKSGIKEKWDSLVNWFKNLWNSLTGGLSINIDTDGGGGQPQATGLPYVPNSGSYLLHTGEAVLTANQARDWRNGDSSGNTVNLTVYTQEMTESQVEYLVNRVNIELGGMLA